MLAECFCAHFTMLPMWSRSLSAMTGDLSLPNREDVNYLKIVHRTKTRLVETCGQFNPEYERTLVLVSRSPCLQTWAMIDGVLAWMGILGSDIVEARKKYHSFDSEIIVERPGDPTGQIDMLSFQDEGDPPLINDPEGDCGYDADRANDAKWQPLRSDENGNSWGNQDYWMNISPPGTPRVEETP